MKGLRKTIYIPNDGTWESVQAAAKARNRSVSNYLIDLHKKTEPSPPVPVKESNAFFKPNPKPGQKVKK